MHVSSQPVIQLHGDPPHRSYLISYSFRACAAEYPHSDMRDIIEPHNPKSCALSLANTRTLERKNVVNRNRSKSNYILYPKYTTWKCSPYPFYRTQAITHPPDFFFRVSRAGGDTSKSQSVRISLM